MMPASHESFESPALGKRALTSEDKELLKTVAKKLVMKQPNIQVLRPELQSHYSSLSKVLQNHITKSDARRRLLLPDLSAYNNETVAIFSDYSGEGAGDFLTYTVLVCAFNPAEPLLGETLSTVRAAHKLGEKEIAFKDFGMGQVRRALPAYLNAMNAIPGFLFTLAVEKRLKSFFGLEVKAKREAVAKLFAERGFGSRKTNEIEKVLRVTHLVAFLTGLLARTGQKIFWMTDHDAISANEQLRQQTLHLYSSILPMYTSDSCRFSLVGGAVPFETRHIDTLDLLSITDIVSGAINNYLTQARKGSAAPVQVKDGAQHVLQWLAADGLGLKKMNLRISVNTDGTMRSETLEFARVSPPEDEMTIAINTD